MKLLSWEELLSTAAPAPLSATIGVFDGLHLGHRLLIERVLRKEGLLSAVLTFKENPKRILSPSTFHGELSTLDQRLSLIDSTGIDLCVLIDFSGEFSKLPGRQFLSRLRDSGDLRFLAVGSNFRCGHRLDTDAEGIRAFCEESSIAAEILPALQWEGHPVSSSRIRKAILEGRLDDAASMLGRPYEIDLRGALVSAPGRLCPMGMQAAPPPGSYEAGIARTGFETGLDDDPMIVAELGGDGSWAFSPAFPHGDHGTRDAAPIALRLYRRASRK